MAIIMEVLQHQQAQQPPPPPPPPVVRIPASIIINFVWIALPTFSGEGDPILAKKWEEQIVKHLDALEVQDDATRIRLATFQFRDLVEVGPKFHGCFSDVVGGVLTGAYGAVLPYGCIGAKEEKVRQSTLEDYECHRVQDTVHIIVEVYKKYGI